MTKSLSGSIFHDETAARAWFEALRWPDGPVCPQCKWTKYYSMKKTGVYRCADMTCMRDFTVKTGTVMARSHVKLTQWATAFHLAGSKSAFSARQLQRELGCHYNTAHSLFYRVREAMLRGSFEVPTGSDEFAPGYTIPHGARWPVAVSTVFAEQQSF
jgi:transposase-like protein